MYMLTIADQTRLFLLALGLGFLLGIVYDLFRVVRMAFTCLLYTSDAADD